MNVTRRSCLRRVHVSVRVEPDKTKRFVSLAIISRHAGEGSNRNRVITAQNNWKFPRRHDLFDGAGELLTGAPNLVYIFKFILRFRDYMRSIQAQVTEIANAVAEVIDALIQTSDT